MKAYLNASEVARLVNVDRATVTRWVKKGVIKGGTGKTTTSVNTAAALVKKGKRVLLFDLDPDHSHNLYDVFMGTKHYHSCLC